MNKEHNLLKLLTDAECLGASNESFTLAAKHKQSAESIAKNGSYGTAVSLLVLSTEEVVKGLLLRVQNFGIKLRDIPGMHMFFTDHIIRHDLATQISMMYPMLKLTMGFIRKAHHNLHNPGSKIEFNADEQAFISKDEKKIQTIFQDVPDLLDWWDEANLKKNRGLYVDYSDGLETPMQVTEEEYDEAVYVVETFTKQIENVVSSFAKASPEDRAETVAMPEIHDQAQEILTQIIEHRKKERKDNR